MRILTLKCGKEVSNSTRLLTQLMSELENKNHSVKSLNSSDVTRCTGCMSCHFKKSCKNKDSLNEILYDFEPEIIIFSGPIYFFSINSEIQKCLERLYCYQLKGKVLGYILTSGSGDTLDSGVDLVKNQLDRVDWYCGTKSILFQKITNDKLLEVSETEKLGLNKFLEDLEVLCETT